MSTGKVRQKPWNKSRSRAFNPDDRCYNCGGRGHYAYDCRNVATRHRFDLFVNVKYIYIYVCMYIYV